MKLADVFEPRPRRLNGALLRTLSNSAAMAAVAYGWEEHAAPRALLQVSSGGLGDVPAITVARVAVNLAVGWGPLLLAGVLSESPKHRAAAAAYIGATVFNRADNLGGAMGLPVLTPAPTPPGA